MRSALIGAAVLVIGSIVGCSGGARSDATNEAASSVDTAGFHALDNMNVAIDADRNFYQGAATAGLDLAKVCAQLVHKDGDPGDTAHIWWGDGPCASDGSLMAGSEIHFDFLASSLSASDVPTDNVVAGTLAYILRALGHGSTRFGYFFDVSEPNQPIGFWVEDDSETPSVPVMFSLCTTHNVLGALPSQQFASTCTPQGTDGVLTSVTFAHPTPVDTSAVQFDDDQEQSIGSGNADYSDYDTSANRTYRAQPVYRSATFSERVARAHDIAARVQLYSGNLTGYAEHERNAALWRRDFRQVIRYQAVADLSRTLARRR